MALAVVWLAAGGFALRSYHSAEADTLRLAGWRTALVGKSHLQNITAVPPPWPAPSASGHSPCHLIPAPAQKN